MSRELYVELDFGDRRLRVGTLLYSEKMNRHVFSYDTEFLTTGYEISPLRMPLSDRTFGAEYIEDFQGLHGIFADSLPDAWGMRVQDLEFEKIGIYEPTPLDRLAFIGRYSMGALRYVPAQEFDHHEDILKYADLRKSTQRIIQGDVSDVAEELLRAGGSAGGARPKFLVDVNRTDPSQIRYTKGKYDGEYVPVLMKVPVDGDDNWQRIEYVYSVIARKAGLSMPECYLLEGREKEACFATVRFDVHENGQRVHMATLAGLKGEPFRLVRQDYADLFRTTEAITKDHREVVEAFRRMVFNYLGCSRDDHPKNFSFVMDESGTWKLSPAYDVGFSKGEMNHNIMGINGKTMNPTVREFEKIAREFRVHNWKEIIARTTDALKELSYEAQKCGIRETMIRKVTTPVNENVRRVEKDLSLGVE
jgi:serine/threonine-protein kinase HipA